MIRQLAVRLFLVRRRRLGTRQPLIDLVAKISEKESQLVVPADVKLVSAVEDHPAKSLARTMIVTQTGQPIPDFGERIIPYLVNGTVYALSGADGAMRWWRQS